MAEWGKKDYANNIHKYLSTNHPGNTNVYLVNSGRLANATFGGDKAVAHQGWVKINQGTGFVSSIAVSNVSAKVYTSGYLAIAGANTTAANARMVVTGGNNISIIINNVGAGYNTTPTITASGANNNTLVFTASMGGRAGRIIPETLVVLSDPQVTDANSGLPYFTGL